MDRAAKRLPWALLLIPILLTGGCATGGGASGGVSDSASRDVLTEADLAGMDELSAYGAIRRHRPEWLRGRGQTTFQTQRETVRVYVDGSFYGTVESLSDLTLPSIQEIRYLDAREATLRFGTGHTMGAILVTMKRG